MDSTEPRPQARTREPKTCTIDDCNKRVVARGWCTQHYSRWRRNGDPGIPTKRKPKQALPCVIEGCDRSARSRGLCSTHYTRWHQHGDPLAPLPVYRTGCSVEGCERRHNSHGYCSVHADRFRKWGDPNVTYGHHPPTETRFWSKVNKAGPMPPQSIAPGLCWEWTGSKTPGGYGQFYIKPRRVQTHRFAYESLVGPIADGLQLDHLCRNRACVNPAHLEPVTQQENIRRGFSVATYNRLKTHCPQGHPYDAANTYIHPANNGRICRACARERSRVAYQKRKTA